MSVINQMLVDLEERRAADRPAIEARQTAYAAGPRHRLLRVPRSARWAVAIAAVVAVVYASHQINYSAFLALLEQATSAVAGTRDKAVTTAVHVGSSSQPITQSPRPNPHPPLALAQPAGASVTPVRTSTLSLIHI